MLLRKHDAGGEESEGAGMMDDVVDDHDNNN